jgi:hypothetical protein
MAEALAEDVRGDARRGIEQVAEAARPVQQGGHQEQGPLVADAVESVVQRTGVLWGASPLRHG